MTNNPADLVKRLGRHSEHPVTGRLVLTNPNGPEAATLITRLQSERDKALRECVRLAREAGEAKGRLEASEMAGVVEGWIERCKTAEAALERAKEALREIDAPIAFMQKRAEAEGNRLSGMAYSIANSPSHLQNIARQTLAALEVRS